jgi:hypothetical protein
MSSALSCGPEAQNSRIPDEEHPNSGSSDVEHTNTVIALTPSSRSHEYEPEKSKADASSRESLFSSTSFDEKINVKSGVSNSSLESPTGVKPAQRNRYQFEATSDGGDDAGLDDVGME